MKYSYVIVRDKDGRFFTGEDWSPELSKAARWATLAAGSRVLSNRIGLTGCFLAKYRPVSPSSCKSSGQEPGK